MQTDRVSAWKARSATVSLPRFIPLPASFILYKHRCTRHNTIAQRACSAARVINRLPYNQSCWCQLDRNCDQPTSTTTNVVDDTAYYSASSPAHSRGCGPPLRMDTIMRWSVVKHNFTYPSCIWRPRWWWYNWNFVEIFCIIKLLSVGYRAAIGHIWRT